MTAVHIGRLRHTPVPQNVVAPIATARDVAVRATVVFRNRRRASSVGTWFCDRANRPTVTCEE